MRTNNSMLFLWSLLCSVFVAGCISAPGYKDSSLTTDQRVDDLLARMTLDEKIEQLAGLPDETGMKTAFNKRLAIPEFKMSDGPNGVRWGKSTAYPTGVSLAATFDTALASAYGKALALETRWKGRNYILGPCVNIHRLPTGGRNFESYGEDPWLAGRMAVSYIKAVQQEGVITSVKHFALNNQEWRRTEVDVKAGTEAMYEIFLPAFEMAITEGKAWTVMAAYNKINGWYASENQYLLTEVLRNEWGFKGLVVSDWGATHSVADAIRNGLDLEMPTGEFLNKKNIVEAIQKGQITESDIDRMVRRILWVKFKAGLFERLSDSISADPTDFCRQTAYDVASNSIVLLKNENDLLPINFTRIKSIAVIGPNAATLQTGGGGSSHIDPAVTTDPLSALQQSVPDGIKLVYALGANLGTTPVKPLEQVFLKTPGGEPGLEGEYYKGKQLQGTPALKRTDKTIDFFWNEGGPDKSVGDDNFSVRWSGTIKVPVSRNYTFFVASDDGVRLYIDNKLLIDNWTDHGSTVDSATVNLKGGTEAAIRLEYYENSGNALCQLGWDYHGKDTEAGSLIAEACKAASQCDVAIVFAGSNEYIESEGYDKVGGMKLPEGQDELIASVVAANPRTIVVLFGGTAINLKSWGNKVPAVIDALFPGQEGGRALADIITGKVNPCGKLPFSFITDESQSPAYKGYKDPSLVAGYSEGELVGYRFLDQNGLKPAFPFGHGLSYTTFSYGEPSVKMLGPDSCEVRLKISNTGNREGKEIVQLYVSPRNKAAGRPLKELKGFMALPLKPGESREAVLTLNRRAFSHYDGNQNKWLVADGDYKILIGSSSADIRAEITVTINKGQK